RLGPKVAHEAAEARELQPVEESDDLLLDAVPRAVVARVVEVAPEFRRVVDHVEVAPHVAFAVDGSREIQDVHVPDLRPRPARPRRLFESLGRARVARPSAHGENQEAIHRDCWKSRIAATRKPMTTTAARAFSLPIFRANPAPA